MLAENKTRNQVLRRQSEFLSLKEKGYRYQPTGWLLVNYQKTQQSELRLGMSLSRQVGIAVVRNRLRRWVREYFRLLRSELKMVPNISWDIHVIFKPKAGDFYRQLERRELVAALDAFCRRIGLVGAPSD